MAAILKGILVVVFGGMSFMFWMLKRVENARGINSDENFAFAEALRANAAKEPTPMDELRSDLQELLSLRDDPQARNELCEDVFNRMFELGEISVREAFRFSEADSGKPSDQIDGVIQLDDQLCHVRMVWSECALSALEIKKLIAAITAVEEGQASRGIFISFSGYTDQAVQGARESCKAGNLLILCMLQDFIQQVDGSANVDAMLRDRIVSARVEKNPYSSYPEQLVSSELML